MEPQMHTDEHGCFTGAWAIAKRWPSALIFRATAALWPKHPSNVASPTPRNPYFPSP